MNQLLVLLMLLSGTYNIQPDSTWNKYPVKSGKIVYQYEGRNSCNEIIYFDDYGDLYYELKTSSKTENGNLVLCSTIRILRQDTVVTIDNESNNESRCAEIDCSIKVKQNIISNEMLHEMGYSFNGTDKVSGIICDRYNGENGSMWVWNNIILKSEMEIMDVQISMEAVEIVTGISIAESRFELPNNHSNK